MSVSSQMAPVMAPAAGQHVVLAFGDSLTTGLIPGNDRTAAYTDKLQALLKSAGGLCYNEGMPGQRADAMLNRLQKKLASMSILKISHVAVLAGTNDILQGSTGEAILQALLTLFGAVRAAGATCVAVTIPQVGPTDNYGKATEPRRKVNEGLRAAAAEAAAGRGPPLLLADMDAALAALPPAARNAIYVDTVHMDSRGSELIADVVHAALRSSPAASTGLAAPSPSTSPSMVAFASPPLLAAPSPLAAPNVAPAILSSPPLLPVATLGAATAVLSSPPPAAAAVGSPAASSGSPSPVGSPLIAPAAAVRLPAGPGANVVPSLPPRVALTAGPSTLTTTIAANTGSRQTPVPTRPGAGRFMGSCRPMASAPAAAGLRVRSATIGAYVR